MIPPGSTIGVLGDGQLGRMLALAAARLGYRVHVYAPGGDEGSPAGDVAAHRTVAPWDDADALDRFARAVDVVTYEFENVPVAVVDRLAARVPVRPGARSLAVAQDRLAEKEFARAHGGVTAPFAVVDGPGDLAAALAMVGAPAILKARRLGYDGKGQTRVERPADAARAWEAVAAPAILEGVVPFAAEFSVILARGADGTTAVYEPPRNEHAGAILRRSTVPAGPDVAAQAQEAVALAGRIARALDHVGVIACEFFATATGPVFNELAPRVHNSGHWTIEGAATSQFENHVRAVCGLPLGPAATVRPCVMANLIGDDAARWPELMAEPGAALHLYGKSAARPGRKMGHVTRVVL